MMNAQEKAVLYLAECTDLDYRRRVALLRAAHDPAALFTDFEKISKSVLKEGEIGLYNTDTAGMQSRVEEFLSRLERKNRFAVTLYSDDYPESLKQIPDPPLVLYGEGNRKLLGSRKLCIVGSRITPSWAEKKGERIAEALAARFAVVTGFAEGGDSAAIAGAIKSGNLICVLPCGLDECYPAAHFNLKRKVRETGLLLSESAFHEKARKFSFYARNRILAGLSEGVFVLSAGARSGTLITANLALDYGRDVFAFPHNVGSAQGAGCNELIKKGASLVTDASDILSAYGFTAAEQQKTELPEREARIMEILRAGGELHTAVVAQKAGIPVYEAASILAALEIQGLAVKSGGNQYSAV